MLDSIDSPVDNLDDFVKDNKRRLREQSAEYQSVVLRDLLEHTCKLASSTKVSTALA